MATSPPPSVSPTSGPLVGRVLGKYLVIRLLGEGGMGAVYEAMHQDLGRRVAIKTLHRRYAESPLSRARFLREGQAASRIRHPNVADVYDVATEEDHPYLVMEFLEGEDMSRLIARDAPFSVQRTADLLVPVVAAVAAAHDHGVVHRDLKPENIFLSTGRSLIQPKVLDFGISKVISDEGVSVLTDTGAFLGTPYYVSPEQAQGAKDIGIQSDQYSLGVILYQCTTGRRPVEETTLYAMIRRIVEGDFAPPRQLNPRLPSEFEALILHAMARDPGARFPTTRALGKALLAFASPTVRAFYADELVGAAPPKATVREEPVDEPPRLGTTLEHSVVQRDAPRSVRPTWPWLGAGALAGLAGLAAFRLVASNGGDVAPSTTEGVASGAVRTTIPAPVDVPGGPPASSAAVVTPSALERAPSAGRFEAPRLRTDESAPPRLSLEERPARSVPTVTSASASRRISEPPRVGSDPRAFGNGAAAPASSSGVVRKKRDYGF